MSLESAAGLETILAFMFGTICQVVWWHYDDSLFLIGIPKMIYRKLKGVKRNE